MAVAVKNPPVAGASSPLDRLPIVSLVGAAYVAVGLGVVLDGLALPVADVHRTDRRRRQRPSRPHHAGRRSPAWPYWAPACTGASGPPAPAPASSWAWSASSSSCCSPAGRACGWNTGSTSIGWFGNSPTVGLAVAGAVAVVLLAGLAYLFFRPRTEAFLVSLEAQGWFSAAPTRASRGSASAAAPSSPSCCSAASGVYTMMNNGFLHRLPESLLSERPLHRHGPGAGCGRRRPRRTDRATPRKGQGPGPDRRPWRLALQGRGGRQRPGVSQRPQGATLKPPPTWTRKPRPSSPTKWTARRRKTSRTC